MTTVEEARQTLARRFAARREREHAAAQAVRALLPRLSEALVEEGATQVYLFGFLHEGRFHESSDVDLATWGWAFAEPFAGRCAAASSPAAASTWFAWRTPPTACAGTWRPADSAFDDAA